MVLLHALGSASSDWAPVAETLGSDWRVYAPDLRGHGASDWPGSYTIEQLVVDLAAFLDALELDRVSIAGHSIGAPPAYLYAARHPDRVARLVLEDPAPPWPRARRRLDRPEGPLPFDWDVTALSNEFTEPRVGLWRAELSDVRAPTLLVAGGSDSHIDQSQLADMASLIPSCELVTIPAGHLVHAARPAEFTTVVTSFLRSQLSRGHQRGKMRRMSEIILIRHGATKWSQSGQYTGRTDLPLTEAGEAAVRALGQVLAQHRLVAAFSSPMIRAMRTAELAGLADVKPDPDLLEWDYGGYEGLTEEQIRGITPGWNLWRDGVIPGAAGHPGETLRQVADRVDAVLARVRPLLASGDVALVDHGHVQRVLAARWLGLDPAAARLLGHPGTGTVSLLGFEHGHPVVLGWGAPAL